MFLTILERAVALQVLPAEGNIISLKVVGHARDALAFTEEEIDKFGLKTVEEGMRWDEEAGKLQVPIELTDAAVEIIRKELDKLNGEDKLTAQHVTLFDKVHAVTDAKKPKGDSDA